MLRESVGKRLLRFRVVRWIRTSRTYQIFVVRAAQRRTSLGWYWFSGLFLMFALTWGVEDLNPILELHEMEVREGEVTRVIQRRRGGDKLHLKADNGDVIEYTVSLLPAEGRAIEGRRVMVWSQPSISLLYGVRDEINQIKMKNELIVDYRDIKPNLIMLEETAPTVVTTFLAIALLPLLRVWWVNRKPLVTEGNDVNQ